MSFTVAGVVLKYSLLPEQKGAVVMLQPQSSCGTASLGAGGKSSLFWQYAQGLLQGEKNDHCFLSMRREDQFCVTALQDCPLSSGEENRSSSSTPPSRGWRWGSRYSCSVLPWGSQPLATSGTGMGTCWNTRRKKNSG